MATHDYVIDNSTGANVRADLNLVFQAILTNNSSSSAPSTTAAYMWWADTTNGVLKIRNSANNAWVELLQLDGTLTLEDGSNTAPALAFRDDLNTGIYSSAADTFNISTGGIERMELASTGIIFNETGADVDFRIEGDGRQNLFYVDAGNDRIGINTSTPSTNLHVFANAGDCDLQIESSASASDARINLYGHSGGVSQIRFGDQDDTNVGLLTYDHSDNSMAFRVNDQERGRIDNLGRFGLGTTSPSKKFHVVSSDYQTARFESSNADANGSYIEMYANSASPADNDVLGFLGFRGNNDASPAEDTLYASIRSLATDVTDGTEDGDIVFHTRAAGTFGERMRIDSSGNVGIGTSTPSEKLDVEGTIECLNELRSKTGNDLKLNAGSANRDIFFQVNDSTLMTLQGSSGDFLFNCTSLPSSSVAGMAFEKNGNSGVLFHSNGSATSALNVGEFINGNGVVGRITTNGSNCSFTDVSDYRLKENEVLISDGITRLKQLKPYRFNYKSDASETFDGFFAHEAQAVVPQSVVGEKDATNEDGSIDPQCIDQSKLVPLLVAAVKELITKVETLEAA